MTAVWKVLAVKDFGFTSLLLFKWHTYNYHMIAQKIVSQYKQWACAIWCFHLSYQNPLEIVIWIRLISTMLKPLKWSLRSSLLVALFNLFLGKIISYVIFSSKKSSHSDSVFHTFLSVAEQCCPGILPWYCLDKLPRQISLTIPIILSIFYCCSILK